MTDDTTLAATTGIDSLVGKFFHTTRRCSHGAQVASWQGHIVGAYPGEVLLIEKFEWFMGEPFGQEFVTLADFMGRCPVLYENGDEMRFSYNHGRLAHSHRCKDDETE
jgi:hypothetical protein